MRFLADESCDFNVVRALRDAGYDVVAVSEVSPRAEDAKVIDIAVRDRRVLLTEDKDFGQLVHSHGRKTQGVILLRYPVLVREQLAKDVVRLAKRHGKKLAGCFIVIQPGRVRISRTAR